MKEKSDNYHKAQKYSFWLFARRNHSEKEIREKLGRNYVSATVDAVIEKLKKLKLIDDEKFAKEWSEYRLRNNKSRNFIMRELNKKGIPRETASEILNSFSVNESELAYDAVKSRLQRYKKLEPMKAKSKIFRFLAGRGFSYDTIESVMGKIIKNDEN